MIYEWKHVSDPQIKAALVRTHKAKLISRGEIYVDNYWIIYQHPKKTFSVYEKHYRPATIIKTENYT